MPPMANTIVSRARSALRELSSVPDLDREAALTNFSSEERRALEEAVRILNEHANETSFVDIPSDAVRLVAVQCSGKESYRWCAACSKFKNARPVLRAISVGGDTRFFKHLRDDMIITLDCTPQANAYSTLLRLPASVQSEITHLHINAWETDPQGSDGLTDEDVQGLQQLADGRFTSLHLLSVIGERKGSTSSTTPRRLVLGAALLMMNAPRLKSVFFDMTSHLPGDEGARSLMRLVPRRIKASWNYVAFSLSSAQSVNDCREKALALRTLVEASIVNLQQPALVLATLDGFARFNLNVDAYADYVSFWEANNKLLDDWLVKANGGDHA